MGETVGEVLRVLCLSRADLAGDLGVSYDTVRGWSSRRTGPSLMNRAALADYIRGHARRLEQLADDLDSLVEGPANGSHIP